MFLWLVLGLLASLRVGPMVMCLSLCSQAALWCAQWSTNFEDNKGIPITMISFFFSSLISASWGIATHWWMAAFLHKERLLWMDAWQTRNKNDPLSCSPSLPSSIHFFHWACYKLENSLKKCCVDHPNSVLAPSTHASWHVEWQQKMLHHHQSQVIMHHTSHFLSVIQYVSFF